MIAGSVAGCSRYYEFNEHASDRRGDLPCLLVATSGAASDPSPRGVDRRTLIDSCCWLAR